MRFYRDDKGNYCAFNPDGKGGGILYDIAFVVRLRADSVKESGNKLIATSKTETTETVEISKVFSEETNGTVF